MSDSSSSSSDSSSCFQNLAWLPISNDVLPFRRTILRNRCTVLSCFWGCLVVLTVFAAYVFLSDQETVSFDVSTTTGFQSSAVSCLSERETPAKVTSAALGTAAAAATLSWFNTTTIMTPTVIWAHTLVGTTCRGSTELVWNPASFQDAPRADILDPSVDDATARQVDQALPKSMAELAQGYGVAAFHEVMKLSPSKKIVFYTGGAARIINTTNMTRYWQEQDMETFCNSVAYYKVFYPDNGVNVWDLEFTVYAEVLDQQVTLAEYGPFRLHSPVPAGSISTPMAPLSFVNLNGRSLLDYIADSKTEAKARSEQIVVSWENGYAETIAALESSLTFVCFFEKHADRLSSLAKALAFIVSGLGIVTMITKLVVRAGNDRETLRVEMTESMGWADAKAAKSSSVPTDLEQHA